VDRAAAVSVLDFKLTGTAAAADLSGLESVTPFGVQEQA
jgi:hypothetical protein